MAQRAAAGGDEMETVWIRLGVAHYPWSREVDEDGAEYFVNLDTDVEVDEPPAEWDEVSRPCTE